MVYFIYLFFKITFQTKRLIGQMGNFHIMRMLKLAISGEIINNLNFFNGFNPWLHARFGPVRAAALSASS